MQDIFDRSPLRHNLQRVDITFTLTTANASNPSTDRLLACYCDWWLERDPQDRLATILPLACVHSARAMAFLHEQLDYFPNCPLPLLLQWHASPLCPLAVRKQIDQRIHQLASNCLGKNTPTPQSQAAHPYYDAATNRFIRAGKICNSLASLTELALLLRAFTITNDESFLHVADRYGEAWADALLDSDAVPCQLPDAGLIKANHSKPSEDEKIRAREWIEQGASDLFLLLYRHTSTPIYLIAARKLLDIAASDLRSQDCAYAVRAIRNYYRSFDDGYFDEYVRIAAARNPLQADSKLRLIEVNGKPLVQIHDSGDPVCHPTLQMFYGQLTGRPEHVALALKLTDAFLKTLLPHLLDDVSNRLRWLQSAAVSGLGWLEDVLYDANG